MSTTVEITVGGVEVDEEIVPVEVTLSAVGAQGPPGLSWQGDWDNATTYAVSDVVFFDGSSYIAIQAGLNQSPDTSPAFWSLLAEGGAAGAGGGIAISASNSLASTGTIIFSNSNGVTFGLSDGVMTASYTVPGTTAFSNSNGVTFGLLGSTITASYTVPTIPGATVFSNSNNVSFGLNGSTVTATATVASSLTNVNFSAGNTSNNLSAVTFADGNGISFGLDNGTITASYTVPVIPGATVFSNSNNVSFGLNGSTVTATATVASSLTNVKVSAGASSDNLSAITFSNSNGLAFGLSDGTLTGSYTVPTIPGATVFSNSNNVSFGLNGSTITATATVATSLSNIKVSAGGSSANLSAVTFSNSNGLAFGLSDGTITGSYTVPGATVFSNSNNVSFGLNGSTITATATVATSLSNIKVSAGGSSANLSAVTFSNSNGLAFGLSDGTITGSYTVPGATVFSNSNNVSFGLNGSTITATATVATSLSNIKVSAGGSSANLSAITFSDSNGLAFGLSDGTITGSYTVPGATVFSNSNNVSFGLNGSTITATATVATSLTNIRISAGTTNTLFSNISIANSNNVSFTLNGLTLNASASVATSLTNIQISAGTTNTLFSNFSIANSNNVSFTLNGSTINASASFPAQTNQLNSVFAIGNTTSSSSGTINASSFVFSGLGIASVGVKDGTVMVSVPAGGGGITAVQITAGTTNTNISNFSFSDGSNVSFGINGSTITASVASSLTNIKVSAGANSANLSAVTFSNSNGVSFGLNGSTITASISVATMSYMDFAPNGAISSDDLAAGNILFKYLEVLDWISISRIDIPMIVSLTTAANGNTVAVAFSSAAVLYTANGSTLNPIVGAVGSTTYTYASNTANYNSVNGGRFFSFPLATLLSPGNYILGYQHSTANSSIGTATTALGKIFAPINGNIIMSIPFQVFGSHSTATGNGGLVPFQGMAAGSIFTATSQTFQRSLITGNSGSNAYRGNFYAILRNV
jgi:hypothetical protein